MTEPVRCNAVPTRTRLCWSVEVTGLPPHAQVKTYKIAASATEAEAAMRAMARFVWEMENPSSAEHAENESEDANAQHTVRAVEADQKG